MSQHQYKTVLPGWVIFLHCWGEIASDITGRQGRGRGRGGGWEKMGQEELSLLSALLYLLHILSNAYRQTDFVLQEELWVRSSQDCP